MWSSFGMSSKGIISGTWCPYGAWSIIILANPAASFAVNRFHNDLKSQGIAVGKDSLHEFLACLEDAYLIQTVFLDSSSLRRQQVNPRKIYPVDPGLSSAFRHVSCLDRGRLLETLVFLDLWRRGLSVTYFRSRDGFEVDFLASGPTGEREAVQVSETLADPPTRLREFRAIEVLMEERDVAVATVVTLDEEESVDTRFGRVEVVPVWRWLLRRE